MLSVSIAVWVGIVSLCAYAFGFSILRLLALAAVLTISVALGYQHGFETGRKQLEEQIDAVREELLGDETEFVYPESLN